MKSILTILSARASYSRVRSVLFALQGLPGINSKILLVASAASPKYGRLQAYLEEDSLTIDWKVESQFDASVESSMVRTTAATMTGIADYIINNSVDGVLVVADRHETIAGSIASSYMNRKTFHLQGGENTGNIDQKVRYANSFLSDYHFVATNNAKSRLEKCGVKPESIFNTGCPSLDFLHESLNRKDILNQVELGGIGLSPGEVFKKQYAVVLQHSETTSTISARSQIRATIEAVDRLGIPALWIWPNSDAGSDDVIREITKARESGQLNQVHFERSIMPESFIQILGSASCVIGNSSVAIRECSLLGIPAVNIGGRQRDRDRATNVMDVDFQASEIYDSILKQIDHGRYEPSNLYGDGKSGTRIAKLIRDLI